MSATLLPLLEVEASAYIPRLQSFGTRLAVATTKVHAGLFRFFAETYPAAPSLLSFEDADQLELVTAHDELMNCFVNLWRILVNGRREY